MTRKTSWTHRKSTSLLRSSRELESQGKLLLWEPDRQMGERGEAQLRGAERFTAAGIGRNILNYNWQVAEDSVWISMRVWNSERIQFYEKVMKKKDHLPKKERAEEVCQCPTVIFDHRLEPSLIWGRNIRSRFVSMQIQRPDHILHLVFFALKLQVIVWNLAFWALVFFKNSHWIL